MSLCAVEELDTDTILQPFDLHADRGLRPVQRSRGTRERPLVGHSDKRLQQFWVEGRDGHHEI